MTQQSDFPTNLDVIIIGADAAGMGAARKLNKAGYSVLVIEAADRVGGRAWTQSTSFGVPVDMGCSWISGSNKNKLTKIARKHDFTLVDHTDRPTALFIDGRRATSNELADYVSAGDKVQKAISKAGKKGRDIPASMVIPQGLPHIGAAKAWMGPMDYGVDFDAISTLDDYMSAEDQPSYILAEGLGAVVATLAKGIPISHNTTARTIDYTGKLVSVETNAGTKKARSCVITVSTGVLA